MMLFPASGIDQSNVKDEGDPRTVWGPLNAMVDMPAGTAVVLQTRSGNMATPDGRLLGYQPLGPGGAINSPSARYIQYRALLSTAYERVTPSLERVDLLYDIDRSGPNIDPGAGAARRDGQGHLHDPGARRRALRVLARRPGLRRRA